MTYGKRLLSEDVESRLDYTPEVCSPSESSLQTRWSSCSQAGSAISHAFFARPEDVDFRKHLPLSTQASEYLRHVFALMLRHFLLAKLPDGVEAGLV